MTKEIKLKIVLQNPVEGIIYGLQKGKGSAYETVQAQNGNGQDLAFEFTVPVKPTSDSGFSFSGPFVQGNPDSRFVYITIGNYAGQAGAAWSGRLKVPFPEIILNSDQADTDGYRWICTVPGRTKEGKPLFATVKPFAGWTMQRTAES